MKYENQFLLVPEENQTRTTILIPFSVLSEIKQYEPKHGVTQITISILLTKFLNELKRIKLEPGDREGYQRAIADCNITLAGSVAEPIGNPVERIPTPRPSARSKSPKPVKAVNRNDGPGTGPVA